MPAADDDRSDDVVADPLRITNEFTSIEVRKVFTRNGELLEVRSRKLGFVIRLDPLELEALTWQDPVTFSRLLKTPWGPEDDTFVRPLTDLMVFEASRPDSWNDAPAD